MRAVIRILVFALAAVGLLTILRKMFGGSPARPDVKCADCIHCRKLFHDGVRCGFGAKEVFKNPAHIDICVDLTRRG